MRSHSLIFITDGIRISKSVEYLTKPKVRIKSNWKKIEKNRMVSKFQISTKSDKKKLKIFSFTTM